LNGSQKRWLNVILFSFMNRCHRDIKFIGFNLFVIKILNCDSLKLICFRIAKDYAISQMFDVFYFRETQKSINFLQEGSNLQISKCISFFMIKILDTKFYLLINILWTSKKTYAFHHKLDSY
jgi:hypothetical protein